MSLGNLGRYWYVRWKMGFTIFHPCDLCAHLGRAKERGCPKCRDFSEFQMWIHA